MDFRNEHRVHSAEQPTAQSTQELSAERYRRENYTSAESKPRASRQSRPSRGARTSRPHARTVRMPRTSRKAPSSRTVRTPRAVSTLRRITNAWWDRLLGAASERDFGGQEEQYSSNNTKRDFMWNSIGLAAWGMVFPVLTVVVTQIVGLELAGMFSLAFVTATLLMIIANYGVRTFQVSDLDETHSFSDYQISRWITCAAMIIIGLLYCNIRGYTGDMFLISIGVYLYKMVDGLADVYEGRLQQKDKLYLAGVSQTIRSVSVLVVFSLFLLITHNLGGACIAMAITAIASFIVVTAPLALLETPKSTSANFESIKRLFIECAPLFVALFLYAFIDNMPKFAMEGVLSYDNQLFFNALYFPAQSILMTVGLIYKPLLVKMAAAWADVEHRNRFDIFIVVMVVVILAITAVGIFFMDWIGIPILSFLYGTDFEPYRQLAIIMLVAGGLTGIIDFLYQVITVLRKQKVVMRLYLMTFVCALFVPILMISMTQLTGAVMSYLVLMAILLVLLLWEYVSVRIGYLRDPASEDLADEGGVDETILTNNALMIQQGSTTLGAYPAAYAGVRPVKASGRRRSQEMGESARDDAPKDAPDDVLGDGGDAEFAQADAASAGVVAVAAKTPRSAFQREMSARVDGAYQDDVSDDLSPSSPWDDEAVYRGADGPHEQK